MTKWKIALLAIQWLLLSAQSLPSGDTVRQPQYPLAYQERILPPKEFDHDYDGQLTIRHMSHQEILDLCRPATRSGSGRALACSHAILREPKECTIWMMTEAELARLGWDYKIVIRHELGHCNGWRHD